MDLVRGALTVVAVVLAVILSCLAIEVVAGRESIFYLALSAIVVLPVASSFGLRRKMAVSCICAAMVLALIPVDYTIKKSGTLSLRLLPVSHGFTCAPDTVCRGCIVFLNDPKYAVVFGY